MKIVTVEVEIEGLTSLLQHRFGESAENNVGSKTRRVNLVEETPREAAEKVAYREKPKGRAKKGELYHPAAAIMRLLREAGAAHKQKGSRKSVKWIVPAAVSLYADTIPLFTNGARAKDFEVDSRPVTIPSTKGRIMRHRPRLDEWRAQFVLEIDEEVLPADVIQQLLTEGGRQIGIGDYRPEKGGPFGRFMVTKWEAQG